MNKLDKYLLPLILAICLIGAFLLVHPKEATELDIEATDADHPQELTESDIKTKYAEMCITFNCQTYHSELGFSFKYPAHMFIEDGRIDENDNYRLLVMYKSSQTTKDEPFSAIVINVAENDEGMTPKEWLQGPYSGYDPSKDYYQIKIDGQDGVNTDGGMWVVVNTPDNKKRLSIANLTDEGGNIPFTEMGIVVNTLKFDK